MAPKETAMFVNRFNGARQVGSTLLAFGLISGLIALYASSASAEAQLTCSETARAYASGEIGNVKALEFLSSCVKDRIGTLEAAGKRGKGGAQAATNPLICHQYAGTLAVQPEQLSRDELDYLEACVQTDIGYMRQGK
jgi:hypothetical protein